MVNFFIATESRYYAVEPNCDPLSTTFDKVTCPAPDQIFVLRDKNGLPECAYNLWTGLLVSNMKQGMVCEKKSHSKRLF